MVKQVASDKVRVFIGETHLALLNRDLVYEFRRKYDILNYVAWVRELAFETYDVELYTPESVDELKAAVKADHFGNIGAWLSHVMMSQLASSTQAEPHMKITEKLLGELGFQHQEYPDGWFWVLMPKPGDESYKALYEALGYTEFDMMEVAEDTAILQCDDSLANWSYVLGTDVGSMEAEAVEKVLHRLNEIR